MITYAEMEARLKLVESERKAERLDHLLKLMDDCREGIHNYMQDDCNPFEEKAHLKALKWILSSSNWIADERYGNESGPA